jgi:hypothetical protein
MQVRALADGLHSFSIRGAFRCRISKTDRLGHEFRNFWPWLVSLPTNHPSSTAPQTETASLKWSKTFQGEYFGLAKMHRPVSYVDSNVFGEKKIFRKWMQHVLPQRWYPPAVTHGVVTQRNTICTLNSNEHLNTTSRSSLKCIYVTILRICMHQSSGCM